MYLTNPFLFRKTLRRAVSSAAVTVATNPGRALFHRNLTAVPESVLVGAQAAGLRKASRVAATTQLVAISGPATNLKTGRVLTAAAASVSAGTQDAFLQRSRINGMTKAEIDIVGQSAALLVGRRLFAGQADVVVQPFSVGMLKVAGMLDAEITALDIASPGAALRKHSLLLPSVAGFDIGAPSTRLLKGFKVSAEPQSYAVGTPSAELRKHSKVFATTRDYAIATPAATLTKSAPPFGVHWIGAVLSVNNQTIYDFGSFSFPYDGYCVAGIFGDAPASRTISSVSIGGAGGTIYAQYDGSGWVPHGFSYRSVSAGARNVTATFSGSMNGATVAVWLITSSLSTSPHAGANAAWAGGVTSRAPSFNIPTNGVAMYMTFRGQSPGTTWSTATERLDSLYDLSGQFSAADKTVTAAITPHTETASWSPSATASATGISWGP